MTPPGSSQNETARLLTRLAQTEYCYVTTTGRVTGKPHEIEIWFGVHGATLYLLSGGGDTSDWVRNMRAQPSVQLRIGKNNLTGTARAVKDIEEDTLARRLLAGKYQGWREGRKMTEWARTALPIAIEIQAAPA